MDRKVIQTPWRNMAKVTPVSRQTPTISITDFFCCFRIDLSPYLVIFVRKTPKMLLKLLLNVFLSVFFFEKNVYECNYDFLMIFPSIPFFVWLYFLDGMNEDGSFIGQYGKKGRQQPTNNQAFATLV